MGETVFSDAPSLRESPKPGPNDPPFTRKRVGAHYVWADDLQIAYDFAAEHGLTFELSYADYQVARLSDGQDVRLLIYPHKTKSTGNRHLRVRDENSKSKRRAQALIALLDRAAGFNCTFSFHWTANELAHRWSRDLLNPSKLAAVLSESARKDGASPKNNGDPDV